MIAKDDIVIRKAILHILDTNRGECILSNTLLDPGPDLHDFIRNHIYKIVSSDDTKNCEFDPEYSPIYSILETWDESDETSFIETSQAIANKLYIAMGEGLDIPAADLLFVTFQAEGIIYLALLKMNYKESYTHEVTETPDNPVINTDIIKTHSLLPSATSRIPEAVVINLSDYHIKLLEKKYEINGEKAYYLSENFLVCRTSIPPKKKLNILTRVINNISNKYDGADLKTKMDTKSALQKEYVDNKSFDIEEIGNKLFGKSPEKKSEFDEKMEQYDLQYDNFTVTNESTVKKLEKQVMVTDSGIVTTEAPCGNVAQVNKADIALAQRIIKYRGHIGVVDNTYLKYYLLSPEFQKILNAKSSGGTVQGIKGSILHQQKIIYPSYEEQKKIGQHMDSLDHLITLHQQKCEELKKIKKFMLQKMFV